MFMTTGRERKREGGETFLLSPYPSPAAVLTEPPPPFSIRPSSRYAMTGYGVGFPKGSKWIPAFNKHLMRYRENGDLERMQRFWFTGACEPRKRRRTSSKPLALAQFT